MASVLRVVAVVELQKNCSRIERLSSFHGKNLRKCDANDTRKREKNDEAQLRHDALWRE